MTTPLVLLHPLGATEEFWQPLRSALGSLHFAGGTEAIDLLGHGTAVRPPPCPTIGDFSAAVLDELDRRELNVVAIGGVSLGGLVAQDIAVNHPARVSQLVLADTASTYTPTMRRMWHDRAWRVRAAALEEFCPPTRELWFTEAFRDHPVALHTMQEFLKTDPESYARSCELLARVDITDALSAIRVPTLVLCGEEDGLDFRSAAFHLARRIRDSELVWLPGAHATAVEHPDEFAAAVENFLRRANAHHR